MSTDSRNDPVKPPGEYIRDELKTRGWTQDDLARILGRPLPTVNEVIQGKRAIMPEMAIALGKAFGIPPTVWMKREGDYRLSLAKTDAADVQRRARLYQLAPVKELQRRGWIRPGDDPAVIEQDVLRLLEIKNIEEEPCLQVAFKRTSPETDLTPAQKAWCCRVRQVARSLKVAEYREKDLGRCFRELRKLAAYSQGAQKVPAVLASYGIKFVVVEPLAGAKISAIATWLDEQFPVIGVSLRFDRIDHFWHILGHELSHIKHRDLLAIDTDLGDELHAPALAVKPPSERRADSEASAMLIEPSELESFIARVGPLYSKERINQFANRIKIHPGIIVGQLQYRGEVGYSANREMLVKIRHIVTPVALTDGWGHTIDLRALK